MLLLLIKEDGNAISVLESMIVSIILFDSHEFYVAFKSRIDIIAFGGQITLSIRLKSLSKIVFVLFVVRVVVALVRIRVRDIRLVDIAISWRQCLSGRVSLIGKRLQIIHTFVRPIKIPCQLTAIIMGIFWIFFASAAICICDLQQICLHQILLQMRVSTLPVFVVMTV